MKKLFLSLILIFASIPAFAQEYTANNWGSWASVTAQVTWTFPYKSRTITIMNGSSTTPVCVAFGSVTIDSNCNEAPPPLSNGNHKTFQVPALQWITLNNVVASNINIKSSTGVAASPVSVLVNY